MILIPILVEEIMRIVSTFASMVALTFGLALAAPASVFAGDGAHPLDKHATEMHRVAYAGLSSHATALARVVAPALPATETDGLTRNLDDCVKYGCIDNN
jgi:hypothetical protein